MTNSLPSHQNFQGMLLSLPRFLVQSWVKLDTSEVCYLKYLNFLIEVCVCVFTHLFAYLEPQNEVWKSVYKEDWYSAPWLIPHLPLLDTWAGKTAYTHNVLDDPGSLKSKHVSSNIISIYLEKLWRHTFKMNFAWKNTCLRMRKGTCIYFVLF